MYPSRYRMVKKIGFIDHYIDEWHANHFPEMIRKSAFNDRFEVAMAWAETDPPGKKSLDDWCREQNVPKAESLEEVVDGCDCIAVLSPDNPERHMELAARALRSGKPVYVDKPFAAKLSEAGAMFDIARECGTPLMTGSALRFAPDLVRAAKENLAGKSVRFASAWGSGRFEVYAIHLLEMLVMALGIGARRVMHVGNPFADIMTVDYRDGRRGVIQLFPGYGFGLSVSYGLEENLTLDRMDGFFEAFLDAVLGFFLTGRSAVPEAETLEIIALFEAGLESRNDPDRWLDVPVL